MTLFFTLVFFFLGAIVASFMTVIAERMYTGQSWIHGRSRCNSCSRVLTVLDLVPVFSWIFSKGRCRSCGSRVPALYAIGEAFVGSLFAYSYLLFDLTPTLLVFLPIIALLTFIVLYDLRHTVVPPGASLLLLALTTTYAFLVTPNLEQLGTTFLTAGLIGLGFFLLFALSRGRAMGLGDSPAALALSLLAGSQAIAGLLFSFWIGAVVGIGILVTRRKGHRMGIEVPFVPFLAAGYLLAIFTQWNPLALPL